MYEAYVAYVFFAFCGVMMALLTWHCFVEPTIEWVKTTHKKIKDARAYISMEDVIKIVEDAEFNRMVEDVVLKGKKGEPLGDSTRLPCLVPCTYHNCSRHMTRADCCNSEVVIDGRAFCRAYVDINTMQECGTIPTDPNLVTEEEAKEFAEKYIGFVNYLKRTGQYNDEPMQPKEYKRHRRSK